MELRNGGRIDNEGQLWFGSYTDHHPSLSVQVTIKRGTIDLHGGNVPPAGSDVAADLLFTYSGSGSEEYHINFTGAGSLIVDASGIKIATATETGIVVEPNISYQNLWSRGLIRANGMSGLSTPAPDFATLFTVTGNPGSDNYTLTSRTGNPADLTGDGIVDGVDLSIVYGKWGTATPNTPGNFDGSADVDGADLAVVYSNWTGDSVASVPEPTAASGFAVTALAWLVHRTRQRS